MRRAVLPLPRAAGGSHARAERGGGSPAERWLLFEVGGERYAIAVGFLREVVLAEGIGSSPDPPGRDCEIFIHRGSAIPAVDLGVVFGYGPRRRAGESRVLVGEATGRRFGLVVDRVGDVVEISPQALLPMPEGATTLPAACFRGVWCREDRVALVLDPAGLAGLECVGRVEAAAVAPASGRVEGIP